MKEPPEAAANDSRGLDWQTGQQANRDTGRGKAGPYSIGFGSALAIDARHRCRLTRPPARRPDTMPAPSEEHQRVHGPPVLPPLPPPLVPLPPGAVGTGILETPCRGRLDGIRGTCRSAKAGPPRLPQVRALRRLR